jgi:ABC-2 type transport system ATP-binding protein
VLNAIGIEKSYGEIKALRGASLHVEAGTIVSLLGRNGAGKSTLLSVIAGLTRPDVGSVSIDGLDVLANPAKASGLVGIAPQHTGIYPPLTVRENLEFFGELSGLKRVERRKRANDVAEQLGLSSLLDRKASNLSGGEARRLHTGCALVHRPKLLMLDEPTVGADVSTRVQLIEAVKTLADEGAAVVYTTTIYRKSKILAHPSSSSTTGSCWLREPKTN